eukprot:COSAG06_NODE_38466_length_423_cov_0.922840_1_plen_89_part_10
MQPYYSTSGAKNDRINLLRAILYIKCHHFTKTGSGQTNIGEAAAAQKGIMRFSARRFALGHRRERRRHRLRVQHGWALLAGTKKRLCFA